MSSFRWSDNQPVRECSRPAALHISSEPQMDMPPGHGNGSCSVV
ncbi:hypothetical protein SS05631_b59230 (plasmid) [Sinorhizobium sp. CCBAU 05631]|nr:hypothetical protein SS05631_b59230 [Sinorhizobium sp. CCBAU 05631]